MKTMKSFGFLRHFGWCVAILFVGFGSLAAQTFRPVSGWPDSVNQRIEHFLNSTLVIQQRKVAVFDCDGTLFGQAPYYLADEAIYAYAKSHYEGKKDARSREKMKIIDRMLHGSNTGMDYVTERIDFLSGMTTEEVKRMGEDCFKQKYRGKFYPQMRELLADLKAYGFEIWVLSASPELLYQQFVHEQTGIPEDRILGVKSVVVNDTVTSQIVLPVPQDAGKAAAVQTFIKAQPLFAGGNSRGDMEMMNTSVGLKLIVNPDGGHVEKGPGAGDMDGQTVEGYWKAHDAVIVHCNDVPEGDFNYVTGQWGIKANKSNPDK
jgi:phosphoserine phosphatase